MIFNPMFFSESGNMTTMISKPNKLAKNKYLFSDIVKVVLNPQREQKKLLEKNIENIINPELKIIPGIEQSPAQLKFKFLDDNETINAKLKLADILPDEIANMLVNDNPVVSNGKAVSYVSKEPLNSELQKYLNGLVGEDIIKNNIGNGSGIFLSLEDAKSAVNIELTQDSNNQNKQSKIIVQTLVIPEKSKLLSLLDNKNDDGNVNTKTYSINNHRNIQQNIINSEFEENNTTGKPTLSVYSFKNDSQLNKNLQEVHNDNGLKILKNISNTSSNKHVSNTNGLLDKISFVPRDYKAKTDNSKNLHLVKPEHSVDSKNKIDEPNVLKKNYNVSKITILKKQDIVNSKVIKTFSSDQISNSLKKIEFKKNQENHNSDLHIVKNINKKSSSKISNENINTNKAKVKLNNITAKPIEKEVSQKEINNLSSKGLYKNKPELINKDDNTKNTNEKNLNINKQPDKKESIETKVKKANIRLDGNETKPVTQKNIKEKVSKLKDNKANIDTEVQKVKGDLDKNKIENSKPSINIKSADNLKNTPKEMEFDKNNKVKQNQNPDENGKIVKPKLKSTINSEVENKEKNLKVELGKKEFKTGSTILESKEKQSIVNKSELNTSIKENASNSNVKDEQTTESSNSKDKTNLNENKTSENIKSTNDNKVKDRNGIDKKTNVQKENSKPEKNEKVIANEIQGKGTDDEKVNKDNKKLSLKVKGSVKNVSENSKTEMDDSNVKHGNNQFDKQNGHGTDSQNENLNSSNNKNHIDVKLNNENHFNNVLHKEGVKVHSPQPIVNVGEHNSNQQIIKSIEVIKEITKFISQKENGTFSFKIEPEHLGKMKITIDTIDKLLKATIEVDNDQSKQLIERNINKLHSQLTQNGVELNSLNISLKYSKNNKNDSEVFNNNKNQTNNNSQVGETEETPKQKKSLGYNTYEFIA